MRLMTLPLATLALAPLLGGLAPDPAAAGFRLAFPLTGVEVVPPVTTTASGACVGVLETAESDAESLHLTIGCDHDAPGALATGLYRGDAGTEGSLVAAFSDGDTNAPEGPIDIDLVDAVRLLTGGLFVEVQNAAHPDGVLRGQARVLPRAAARSQPFFGSGSQLSPPVATEATARCIAFEEAAEITVVCSHDVAGATGASLRIGGPGAAGTLFHSFDDPGGGLVFADELALSPGQLQDLLEGRFFVRVDSPAHPAGEVRAQIDGCFASSSTLCLNRGRFAVEVDWKDFQDREGFGTAVPQTADAGLFWFFGPDNLELQVKVLDACGLPGFETFWVFTAAATNVEYEVRVTDLVARQTRTYRNELGVAAQPVLDVAAFDTCP